MARLLALCSLPRTNQGDRLQYVRRNGPYTLVMTATGLHELPYGTLPRPPGQHRAGPVGPYDRTADEVTIEDIEKIGI